ncbi:kinase-like domain-containing protein [Aspergillus unguis]
MDRHLLQKAQYESGKVFKPQSGRPQLRLSIVERVDDGHGNAMPRSLPEMQINTAAELEDRCERNPNEYMRIYTIQHVRTWSGLDISFGLMKSLMEVHQMFPKLWTVLSTFKVKFSENEYGFPLPQRRQWIDPAKSGNGRQVYHTELAYVMRRVEENGRSGRGCPWSIRQTGVYQQLIKQEDSAGSSPIILLVAPSSALERGLEEMNDNAMEPVDAAFSVHKIVVAEGLTGWMGYMCWLEEQLKIKEATIIAPPLHGNFENRNIGFLENSRHELKSLEDMITDMNVILDTTVRNISWLKTSRERYCSGQCTKPECTCQETVNELEDYAEDAKVYQDRAKVLQSRVRSVQRLLSDILSYEEARMSKDLMSSAVEGNKAMEQLALIGLTFMPITLVENFFSTVFAKSDGDGLHISRQETNEAVSPDAPQEVQEVREVEVPQQNESPENGRRTFEPCPRPPLPHNESTGLGPVVDGDELPALKRLFNGLRAARVTSRPARPLCFVPRTDIRRLVNEELEETLKEIQTESPVEFENILSYRQLISQQALCLFAILVAVKKAHHIIQFLNEGIQDENLPLTRPENPEASCSALVTKQKACIDTLKGWDAQSISTFETKQYRMLSDVFRRGKHYNLDELAILPFIDPDTELGYKPLAAGGFGEVSRECIHPDHHEFEQPPGQKGLIVAVKQMFRPDDFEPERKVYRDLGHSSHRHLIDLLFTFKLKDRYHFVFPWADGTLKGYWERNPQPEFTPDLLLWSVEQMVGIADGLAYFHQFTNPARGQTRFGRHGDIKADNILWFRKENLLKIADLGLASVRGRDSRSNVPHCTVFGPPTYSPPEVKREHNVSRKWDIWSLGCLYLEYTIYLVGGCDAIAEFVDFRSERSREFHELHTDYFYSRDFEAVKPSVVVWVHRMKRARRCSKMMCDILDLIMKKMIVVDPDARSTSREVQRALQKILDRARTDREYLLEPDPAARRAPSPRIHRSLRHKRPSDADPQSLAGIARRETSVF